MPDVPAVSIRGITKRYGKLTAVSNLNLEVAPGEILGFLGLNGAGKTTTIRILLDLLRPTAGKAFVKKLISVRGRKLLTQAGFGVPRKRPLRKK